MRRNRNSLLVWIALCVSSLTAPGAFAEGEKSKENGYKTENSISTQSSEEELNLGHQHVKNAEYKRAYKQFKKLAKKGCPYSQCIVGIMHQKGIGTKKDSKRAKFWLEKSASQGFNDAEHRLGLMHITGDGIEKNVEKGVALLQSAVKHGAYEAQLTLTKIQTEGAETIQQGESWIAGLAGGGISSAQNMASQFPTFSNPEAGTGSSTLYEKGLMGLQKSWSGYGDIAKTLDSLQSRKVK